MHALIIASLCACAFRSPGLNPSTGQVDALLQLLAQGRCAAHNAGAAASGTAFAAGIAIQDGAATGDAPPGPTGPAPATAVSSEPAAHIPVDQLESIGAQYLYDTRKALARDDFHMLLRAFRCAAGAGRG